MLCYWILKRTDGTPAGLVRVIDDRVTLTLSAPVAGTFTLFSDTDAVPVLPDREVHLPGAAAVLGAEGTRVTCFAAAETAAPLSVYRKRLSHIYTKSEEPVAPPVIAAPAPEEMSRNHTMKAIESEDIPKTDPYISHNSTMKTPIRDSIADTARETESFTQLLKRAEAFYAAYEENADADNMVQKEDSSVEAPRGIMLFPQEYPGACWRYIEGADVLPHYEGTWKQPNGQTLHILAVRGRAAPRPPRALLGFTRFLRDENGVGYWLRLTPLP